MPSIDSMTQSKFLKKEDIGEPGDSAIVTILGVKQMNVAKEDDEPELKWVIGFREFPKKPMVLNGTNQKLAAMALGSKMTEDWTGKQIEVYHDPSITFGDKLVGGLRFRKQGGKVRPAANQDADAVDPNDPPFR